MQKVEVGSTDLKASRIIMGCLRLKNLAVPDADNLFMAAMEQGINHFDNADVYESEETFGKILKLHPDLREQIILQTKCGILFKDGTGDDRVFDFSKQHILQSIDGSLKKLGVDQIDLFLLHRPDALVEPEEVSEAFETAQKSGKVKHFGVSNQNPMQIQLLNQYLKTPIVVNQLHLNPVNSGMIQAGLNVNMNNSASIDHDGGILDFCRLNNIKIQVWSPLQGRLYPDGVHVDKTFLLDREVYPELNNILDQLAEKYTVSPTAILFAWVLRHPAKMQVLTGTTKVKHLVDACDAVKVDLTRDEWYSVYKAAGYKLP